jgi:hypothetical protein
VGVGRYSPTERDARAGSAHPMQVFPLDACEPRADDRTVFTEVRRVLRPGGALQFADIANGRAVPSEALRDIDLWTG